MACMKFPTHITLFLTMLAIMAGCAKQSAPAVNALAREDADAKVRAEAARKEMQTLPKVFRTPNYLKKVEPDPADSTAQTKTEAPKK